MKRNCVFWTLLLVTLVVSLGCPKNESPGPDPEPTAVVEETPIVVATETPDGVAVCHEKDLPPGNPPVCLDRDAERVACPSNMADLPDCEG